MKANIDSSIAISLRDEGMLEVGHERPDLKEGVVSRLTLGDVLCTVIQVNEAQEQREAVTLHDG